MDLYILHIFLLVTILLLPLLFAVITQNKRQNKTIIGTLSIKNGEK